jgi:hypothetical protein
MSAPTLRTVEQEALPTKAEAQQAPISARQTSSSSSPGHLLSEFSLKDKVIVVSGGARGLGLVQIEACLEAGAKGKTTIKLTHEIFPANKLLTTISSSPCP